MVSSNIWNDKDILLDEKNQEKYNKKMRKELLKSEERRRKNELAEIKSSNKPSKSERRKKMTTSKIIAYFIIINCTVVEMYSMWVMYQLADLSALYSLIGAVIGESITYAIYCAKSFKDTSSEETLKFEREKIGLLSNSEKEILEDIIPDDIPTDDDHSGDIPEGEEEIPEEVSDDEY